MKPRTRRRWRRTLAALPLALGVAAAGLYVLLQTDAGRRWMAATLSRALSSETRTVRLDGVRAALPPRAAIDRVTVSDAGGVCVEIRGVEMAWSARRLFAGRWAPRRVRVGSFDLARWPAAGEAGAAAEPPPPEIPTVPAFDVEDVAVGEVRLAEPILGRAVSLSGLNASAGGAASNGVARIHLSVRAGRVAVDAAAIERVALDVDAAFDRSRWSVSRLELSGDGLRASGSIESGAGGAWPTGRLCGEADASAAWARRLWPRLRAGTVSVDLDAGAPGAGVEAVWARAGASDLQFDALHAGAATVRAHVRRDRERAALLVTVDASVRDFTAGAIAVTGAELRVEGPWRAVSVSVSAGGTIEQPCTVEAAGRLRWGEGPTRIDVDRAAIEWAGARARLVEPARIAAGPGGVAIAAAGRMDPVDLSAVAPPAWGPIGGRVAASLRLGGTLAAPELDGGLTGEDLTVGAMEGAGVPAVSGSVRFACSNGVLRAAGEARTAAGDTARAQAQAPARLSFAPWMASADVTNLTVSADARLGPRTAGALTVTGAAVRVAGAWRAIEFDGAAGGVFHRPFTASVAGRASRAEAGLSLELSRATIDGTGLRAWLTEPVRIGGGADGPDAIRGACRAEATGEAPLLPGRFGLTLGGAAGDLRLGGTLSSPEIEGEVRWEGLAARARRLAEAPTLSGSCVVGYRGGLARATAEARLSAGGGAEVRAEAPVRLSFRPWAAEWDPGRAFSVAVDAGLDLDVLNGLEGFANSRIAGRVDLSVAYAGNMAGGATTGSCALVGGAFEHYLLGTVIRDAGVRLVARDGRLDVESGGATDGGKGRLALTGGLRLVPGEGLPCALELRCDKARLLRRPEAEATLSGRLGLSGAVSRMRLDGDLRLDEAVIDLRNVRPAPPTPLIVEETAAAAPAAGRRAGLPLSLRVSVAIPGSLYVRGRSLDSVWAGDLRLDAGGGAPRLGGYLEPRRGTVLLLKRSFKLTDGRIEFGGGWPPEPALRLAAVFSSADLDARVQILGNPRNPEIALTSVPPLPEEEILARILFGKDGSTITPLQALSLASEAAKLRQIGGGQGFLGDMTSALGIDRVEVRETGGETAAPEIAAGKYVGDRSYLELRRTSSTDESDRARLYLQHELRPNVVLEAEGGAAMRSGVGVYWTWDH